MFILRLNLLEFVQQKIVINGFIGAVELICQLIILKPIIMSPALGLPMRETMKTMYRGKPYEVDSFLIADETPWTRLNDLVPFARMHSTDKGRLYHWYRVHVELPAKTERAGPISSTMR